MAKVGDYVSATRAPIPIVRRPSEFAQAGIRTQHSSPAAPASLTNKCVCVCRTLASLLLSMYFPATKLFINCPSNSTKNATQSHTSHTTFYAYIYHISISNVQSTSSAIATHSARRQRSVRRILCDFTGKPKNVCAFAFGKCLLCRRRRAGPFEWRFYCVRRR